MQISCRQSCLSLYKSTLPLSGHREPCARQELWPPRPVGCIYGLDCAVEILTQLLIVPHHVIADVEHFCQALVLKRLRPIQHATKQCDPPPRRFVRVHDRHLVLGLRRPHPKRESHAVPWTGTLTPLPDGYNSLDYALAQPTPFPAIWGGLSERERRRLRRERHLAA